MLHACFTPIALSFTTILWRFYAISDTNLLTICRGASSLFSVVFGFRKVTQEIFSELDETKAETPIFPGTLQNIEEVVQLDQGSATPALGAAGALAAPWEGVGHPWPPDSVLSPINSLPLENPE